ncbi:MAG: hypothetical protein RLZZ01_1420 [Actinomycetota bacterium]
MRRDGRPECSAGPAYTRRVSVDEDGKERSPRGVGETGVGETGPIDVSDLVLPEIVLVSEQGEPPPPPLDAQVPKAGPVAEGGPESPGHQADGVGVVSVGPRRDRVRRVTRVVRHVDPWSTFKVALLFCLVTYVVLLTAGVLVWRVADSTGTIGNVERWFTQFGWETFELRGDEIFDNAWVIGLFLVVGFTGGAVLLATVFNLVSDIIGGVRVTVLEEEVVERRPDRRVG